MKNIHRHIIFKLIYVSILTILTASVSHAGADNVNDKFTVYSSAIKKGEALPSDFTCDGNSYSPPVAWKGVPEDTQYFALSLWHIAPDMEKSYWVIYDIPADIHSLPKNTSGIGKAGYNEKNHTGYDPMCSRGGGIKWYNITVFALSAKPQFSGNKVT